MNEILGRKKIFLNGKFLGTSEKFGNCDALEPSKPFNKNMYMYTFSARLLENSLRNIMVRELKFS